MKTILLSVVMLVALIVIVSAQDARFEAKRAAASAQPAQNDVLSEEWLSARSAQQPLVIGSTAAQPNTPSAGWVYHHDPRTNKWYAHHVAVTLMGSVIDQTIELASRPGAVNGCEQEQIALYC